MAGVKRCSKCKETKPYEMFCRNKGLKDGYNRECKTCVAYYKKAYYEVNREKIKKSSRDYYEANREKVKKSSRDYYEANTESVLERNKIYYRAYYKDNRDDILKYKKAFYNANKEKSLVYWSRRKAIKLGATPDFLLNCPIEKKRLRDIYKLRGVLSSEEDVKYHVDHMWPLSDGGPHWSGNLQIITATENLSKSNKVCETTKKNIRDSLNITKKGYDNDSF
jgi:hypothetical protein